MTILGCNLNINFDQTLAPGSSLCNTLKTKLHAWTESSVIEELMVKFIWQHNLPVGSYEQWGPTDEQLRHIDIYFLATKIICSLSTLNCKIPPGRLDFWCSRGKNETPPVTPRLKSEKWAKVAFEISHHTQLLCQVSDKSVDHNFWPLKHFLRQWHLT